MASLSFNSLPSPLPQPRRLLESSTLNGSLKPISVTGEPPTFISAPGRRIIAVGDLHGDIAQTRRALKIAGVLSTDDQDLWVGGETVLVQLGDILDRGEDEIAILSLLRSLDIQAKLNGGAVYQVNGNHETMNVEGDFRYVDPRAYDECMDFMDYLNDFEDNWDEAFIRWISVSERWKEERKISQNNWSHWNFLKILVYSCWLHLHLQASVILMDGNAATATSYVGVTFLHGHLGHSISLLFWEMLRFIKGQRQKGIVARSSLLRPGGPLACELARHAVVLKVGDWIFCHGGLLPHHVAYGIERMNKEVSRWMQGFNEYYDGPEIPFIATRGYDSVVWSRLYSRDPGEMKYKTWQVSSIVEETLQAVGAKGIVVGHTPQPNGVNCKYNKRIWCVDVGMSSGVLNSRPEVLEIVDDKARVLRGQSGLLSELGIPDYI